ncbi:hypothetical protein BDN71DRAFT_756142 [Pleurotus eryngii]|uniref:Uncharacterized protein n=1 Tax=Pleurotus eryngii TaxID=5323 RepID=A0A9P6A0J6_PLEER|nr:hypothetical protein BDN71DRAFT_756142 [Pleurotus eryngii]
MKPLATMCPNLLPKVYNVKSLPRVGAAYDDNHALDQKRTVCLPVTRIALLEEIGRWAVARDETPIYLLTGHAGFGKSTIVRTVVERLFASWARRSSSQGMPN